MKYKHTLFLLVSWLFFSCGDPHEYTVDSAFTDYVYRFEQEASLRNKQINLKLSGLIIEFANLKEGKAGLCHYEKPIRIEIDKTYWNRIGGRFGADLLKENLIFHELGHGFLDRRHTNEILENGDWKSIMCGGDAVDNKSWNINYRGLRRTYYLDELFNQSTLPPLFMGMQLLADTSGFKQIVQYTFDTNNKADTGWDVQSTTNFSISTEDKKLKFLSKNSNSSAVVLNISSLMVDIQRNISIEMDVNCLPVNLTDQFGIVLSTGSNSTDTTEYFRIDKQQSMYPGNSASYSYYSQLHKVQINKTGSNKLKIIKLNNMLYYFINNSYVYQTETDTKTVGKSFGFIAPAFSTVYIDNLRVAILSASKNMNTTIQKIKSTIQLSTQVYTLEPLYKALSH